MTTALVLLSGGLDSAVCATLARDRFGAKNVRTISFRYGQKHGNYELRAAHDIAVYLDLLSWHLVDVGVFSKSDSSLLKRSEKQIPEVSYSELEGVSPTYVPFRNGTLLSIATVRALDLNCDLIYFGAHAEDAANWAYPDCTPEFIGAMAAAIYVGTYHKVRLVAPLADMRKRDIIKLGTEINAPLHLTRSCYVDQPLSCGKCPTCRSRLEAFESLGMVDVIEYQKDGALSE
ncbi:MAG: 7-cyano-7-deazaguanine synthase QueC [Euryarchaeota archaeon]|nr:7-cyano-7-deazaguanine synthase QueC [Euryarchaeota archaeon]